MNWNQMSAWQRLFTSVSGDKMSRSTIHIPTVHTVKDRSLQILNFKISIPIRITAVSIRTDFFRQGG